MVASDDALDALPLASRSFSLRARSITAHARRRRKAHHAGQTNAPTVHSPLPAPLFFLSQSRALRAVVGCCCSVLSDKRAAHPGPKIPQGQLNSFFWSSRACCSLVGFLLSSPVKVGLHKRDEMEKAAGASVPGGGGSDPLYEVLRTPGLNQVPFLPTSATGLELRRPSARSAPTPCLLIRTHVGSSMCENVRLYFVQRRTAARTGIGPASERGRHKSRAIGELSCCY